MDLEPEFVLRAAVDTMLMVGEGPRGSRTIVPVAGGQVAGPRIQGELVGPGADWAVVGADGFVSIDVRTQVRTVDDAVLYLSYSGVLELTEATVTALGGGETDFGDHYYRVVVSLESGNPRYSWVNRTVFVGRGRLVPDGVEYEVSRLA